MVTLDTTRCEKLFIEFLNFFDKNHKSEMSFNHWNHSNDIDPFVNFENDEIESILDCWTTKPEITHKPENAGFYNAYHDKIQLPSHGKFESMSMYYKVKMHELFHSTGHVERLNRNSLYIYACCGDANNMFLYAHDEIVVELATLFFMDAVNILDARTKETVFTYATWALTRGGLVYEYFSEAKIEAIKAVEYVLAFQKEKKKRDFWLEFHKGMLYSI